MNQSFQIGNTPTAVTGLADGNNYIGYNRGASGGGLRHTRLADGTTPDENDSRANVINSDETFFMQEVSGQTNWLWYTDPTSSYIGWVVVQEIA